MKTLTQKRIRNTIPKNPSKKKRKKNINNSESEYELD